MENNNLCQNEIPIEQLNQLEKPIEKHNENSTIITLNLNEKSEENMQKNVESLLRVGRVYLITCLVNNKRYVGVTTQKILRRFAGHIYDIRRNDRPLYRAMKKYGIENFRIELLEEYTNITEKFLLDREAVNIDNHNTFVDNGCGYNLEKKSKHRFIFSEETKSKWSRASKGKRNGMYGKHHTTESKSKMGAAVVNQQGKNNPFYGKHHTEKSKQGSINYNKSLSKEEHPMYGRKHSLESKEKMRQKALLRNSKINS